MVRYMPKTRQELIRLVRSATPDKQVNLLVAQGNDQRKAALKEIVETQHANAFEAIIGEMMQPQKFGHLARACQEEALTNAAKNLQNRSSGARSPQAERIKTKITLLENIKQRKISEKKWSARHESIIQLLQKRGDNTDHIDQEAFAKVTPNIWKVVQKVFDQHPNSGAEVKLGRPSRGSSLPPRPPKTGKNQVATVALSITGQEYQQTKVESLSSEEVQLLNSLPCSFFKDEQDQIWAIEHGAQGKKYLGQGSSNLVKFAFKQNGDIACYRVNRSSYNLSELLLNVMVMNRVSNAHKITCKGGRVTFYDVNDKKLQFFQLNDEVLKERLNGRTFVRGRFGLREEITAPGKNKEYIKIKDINLVKPEEKAKGITPFFGADGDDYIRFGSQKDIREVGQYIYDCAQQLIHCKGHADVKPKNTAINEEGRAILIDLDIASDVKRNGVGATYAGYPNLDYEEILGQVASLRGQQGKSVDETLKEIRPLVQKLDVFALGMTMFNCMRCLEYWEEDATQAIDDFEGLFCSWGSGNHCAQGLDSTMISASIQKLKKKLDYNIDMTDPSKMEGLLDLFQKMVLRPDERISMQDVASEISAIFGGGLANIQDESWQKVEQSFSSQASKITSLDSFLSATPKERKVHLQKLELELPPVYVEQFSDPGFLASKAWPLVAAKSERIDRHIFDKLIKEKMQQLTPKTLVALLKASTVKERQKMLQEEFYNQQLSNWLAKPEVLEFYVIQTVPESVLKSMDRELATIPGKSPINEKVAEAIKAKQRTRATKRWQSRHNKILKLLQKSGQDSEHIDQEAFAKVTPDIWKVVQKVFDKHSTSGVEVKLGRPDRRSASPPGRDPIATVALSITGEDYEQKTLEGFNRNEVQLLNSLPCSFLKDSQGKIWAIEHGAKEKKSYLGQGSYNLAKFAFKQDGHIACYRVGRNEDIESTKEKPRTIMPFLGATGESCVGGFSIDDLGQYLYDCARQLIDCKGHADFKAANTLLNENGRGLLIDLDLRDDLERNKIAVTRKGYDEDIEQITAIMSLGSDSIDGLTREIRPPIQKLDVFALGYTIFESIYKNKDISRNRSIDQSGLIDLYVALGSSDTDDTDPDAISRQLDEVIASLSDEGDENQKIKQLLTLVKEMVTLPADRISMHEVFKRMSTIFTGLHNIQDDSWQKVERAFQSGNESLNLERLVEETPEVRQEFLKWLELPPVYVEQFSDPGFLASKVFSLMKADQSPPKMLTKLIEEKIKQLTSKTLVSLLKAGTAGERQQLLQEEFYDQQLSEFLGVDEQFQLYVIESVPDTVLFSAQFGLRMIDEKTSLQNKVLETINSVRRDNGIIPK